MERIDNLEYRFLTNVTAGNTYLDFDDVSKMKNGDSNLKMRTVK